MFRRIFSVFCLLLILSHTAIIAETSDEKKISLTVPAAPWALTLPGDNFALEREQVKPDGRHGYFLMSDEKNYMMISVFIEPAVKCKDSKSCRDMVWKLGNPSWENPQNVVLSKIGEVHFFEFLLPSFRGQPVRQQNMYAQFVVDGFWVDMHISKVLYEPREQERFVISPGRSNNSFNRSANSVAFTRETRLHRGCVARRLNSGVRCSTGSEQRVTG